MLVFDFFGMIMCDIFVMIMGNVSLYLVVSIVMWYYYMYLEMCFGFLSFCILYMSVKSFSVMYLKRYMLLFLFVGIFVSFSWCCFEEYYIYCMF